MLIAFCEDSFSIACPDSIVFRPFVMEMASRSIPAVDHNNCCKTFKSVEVFHKDLISNASDDDAKGMFFCVFICSAVLMPKTAASNKELLASLLAP